MFSRSFLFSVLLSAAGVLLQESCSALPLHIPLLDKDGRHVELHASFAVDAKLSGERHRAATLKHFDVKETAALSSSAESTQSQTTKKQEQENSVKKQEPVAEGAAPAAEEEAAGEDIHTVDEAAYEEEWHKEHRSDYYPISSIGKEHNPHTWIGAVVNTFASRWWPWVFLVAGVAGCAAAVAYYKAK